MLRLVTVVLCVLYSTYGYYSIPSLGKINLHRESPLDFEELKSSSFETLPKSELYANGYAYYFQLGSSTTRYAIPPSSLPYSDATDVAISYKFNVSNYSGRVKARVFEYDYQCGNAAIYYYDSGDDNVWRSPCSASTIQSAKANVCGGQSMTVVSTGPQFILHFCIKAGANPHYPPIINIQGSGDPVGVSLGSNLNTNQNQCGVPAVSNNLLNSFKNSEDIVGGSTATPLEYPWQVAFYNNGFFCGGSLIDQTTVITAAHCFYGDYSFTPDASKMTVYLGMYNRSDFFDTNKYQCSVTRFAINQNYNNESFYNDIGLLKINCNNMPLKYNAAIRPVCMPTSDNHLDTSTGTKVVVSGWGNTQGGGTGPEALKQALLQVSDHTQCSKLFTQNTQTDVASWICAISAGQTDATCQGDSGGPLVQYANNIFTLYGAVSFGVVGCKPTYPDVFAYVPEFLSWIAANK